MKKRWKDHYYLPTFLLYYFAILLIPISVVIFTYIVSYNNNKENMIQMQTDNLYQKAVLCDSYIQSAKQLAYQLSNNYQIKGFINSLPPSADNTAAADMYHMYKMLMPYVTTCNYEDIWIGFKKSQTVISSNVVYSDMKVFWREKYQNIFPVYDEWLEWFFDGKKEGVLLQHSQSGEEEISLLTYRANIYTGVQANHSSIFVKFDLDYIQGILENMEAERQDCMLIYEDQYLFENKDVQYSKLKEEIKERSERKGYFSSEIHGKKTVIAFYKSVWFDGIYVSVIQEKAIWDNLADVRRGFMVIVLLTIFFALISIIFFALRTAAPWSKLLHVINIEPEGKKVPLSIINQQVEMIVHKNSRLSEQLENLKDSMRKNVVTSAMTGQYKDGEELITCFEELGIYIRSGIYIVIIATINEIDTNKENSLYRFILNEIIQKKLSGLVGFYEMDIQNEMVLLNMDAKNYVDVLSQIEAQVSEIQVLIQKEYDVNISFSGSMCDKLENIFQCSQEARAAMRYEEKRNNLSVSWFRKGEKIQKERYQYSLTTETDLLREVTKGNLNKVKSILEKIEEDNFKRNQCTKENQEKLAEAMAATFYRLLEENNELEDRIQERTVILQQTPEFHSLCLIFAEAAEYFKHGIYANEDLNNKILWFVNNNYTNNQMSLTMVADNFEITEIFLSKFFKEKNGMNFSKYIESLRMEKAQELLKDSSLSVQVISERVGYNSPQVFRRGYKKVYGKTPRE